MRVSHAAVIHVHILGLQVLFDFLFTVCMCSVTCRYSRDMSMFAALCDRSLQKFELLRITDVQLVCTHNLHSVPLKRMYTVRTQVVLATLLKSYTLQLQDDHPVPDDILGLGMRASAVHIKVTPLAQDTKS